MRHEHYYQIIQKSNTSFFVDLHTDSKNNFNKNEDIMNQKNISVQTGQELSSLKSIELTKEKIKKVSKKLHQNISKNIENGQSFSLSMIQESFASALGFRNWNSLDKNMNDNGREVRSNNVIDENLVKRDFLRKINSHDLVKLSILKLRLSGEDMWDGRAISCSSAICNVVVYLRDKGELNLTVDSFYQCFNLDVICRWLNNSEIPNEVKKGLLQYVCTIPGYQRNGVKQSDMVLEQHGYVTMLLFKSKDMLELIIDQDMCIWDEKWLELKKENEIVSLYLEKSVFKESDFNDYKNLLKLKMVSPLNNGKLYVFNILEMYLAAIGGEEERYYKKMLDTITTSWVRCKSITEAINVHL